MTNTAKVLRLQNRRGWEDCRNAEGAFLVDAQIGPPLLELRRTVAVLRKLDRQYKAYESALEALEDSPEKFRVMSTVTTGLKEIRQAFAVCFAEASALECRLVALEPLSPDYALG